MNQRELSIKSVSSRELITSWPAFSPKWTDWICRSQEFVTGTVD